MVCVPGITELNKGGRVVGMILNLSRWFSVFRRARTAPFISCISSWKPNLLSVIMTSVFGPLAVDENHCRSVH